jgi:hypothetical protein
MNKTPSALVIFFSALLFGAGCLLAITHTIWHAPEYISAYMTRVDHPIRASYPAYAAFLKLVVKRDQVDYALARNSKELDKAVKEFASVSCDEFEYEGDKLLYWINAYNLLVVKDIADKFPVANLNEVSNELSSRRFTVGGIPITVKDIRELKIARFLDGTKKGDTSDARMIFLIAGGAKGYPVLCDHPITDESLSHDMQDNTYKFLSSQINVRLTKEPYVLLISPFFQWNQNIIQRSFDNPWDFVIGYMPKEIRPDTGDYHLKQNYLTRFDWRINDIAIKD